LNQKHHEKIERLRARNAELKETVKNHDEIVRRQMTDQLRKTMVQQRTQSLQKETQAQVRLERANLELTKDLEDKLFRIVMLASEITRLRNIIADMKES
jgi:hypothetical protein